MNANLQKKSAYLLICLFCFVGIVIILPVFPDLGDFYNNYWGPSNLLLSRHSPYDIKQLFPYTNSLWMPQFISAGLWLGFLEKEIAGKIWVFLNFVSFFFILFTMMKQKPNPIVLGILLIGLFLFPPMSTYFLFGQASLICIAFLLLSLKTDSPLSPLFLILGLGKPQLGFLFLIGIILIVYKNGWYFFAKYILMCVAWMTLLLSPFFLLFPNWIQDFIQNFRTNAPWDHPTLFNILNKSLGYYGVMIWAVLLGISIIATILIWSKTEKHTAAAIILALTILVSPYLWSWDFVLLFPLIILTVLEGSKIKRYAILLGLGVTNIIFWKIRISGSISDVQNWTIPIILLGFLILAYLLNTLYSKTKPISSASPSLPVQ